MALGLSPKPALSSSVTYPFPFSVKTLIFTSPTMKRGTHLRGCCEQRGERRAASPPPLLPSPLLLPARQHRVSSRDSQVRLSSTSFWHYFPLPGTNFFACGGRDGQHHPLLVFVDGGHRKHRAASRHARCRAGCVCLADDEFNNNG
jgi:hypothetical protein